ncbi:50S ribosomal protein L6 [Desulfurella sp.]|uniref:50S ribosomal protein L6 n=1 Tax=Desulfurella sp. TaxID=1962857 RepID=UPI0025C1AE4C|nr:50S ribosomal protein L6 [Desulfurella sp.]
MSRIGKKVIELPKNVDLNIEKDKIIIKGPKGVLTQTIKPEFVEVVKEGNTLIVKNINEENKKANAFHGLYRSLIANAVYGVTNGFKKELIIEGVGYRASVESKKVKLSLGFSHDIFYPIPDGITVEVDKTGTNLTISGIDKYLVGQVAADIRAFKKVEPYKGKGIRYKDEKVRRKAGKAAGK